MKLKVCQAKREDVYRDIVRIPEKYRIGNDGRVIPEGSICRIQVADKAGYAILRGLAGVDEGIAKIDERLRNTLGISIGDEVEILLKRVGFVGQFLWAWSASDPAYRVMARVAVLSVVLGALGLFLGIISLLR